MKLRDLTGEQLTKLQTEGDKCYEEWMVRTNGGMAFGKNTPIDFRTVFRFAFSKGVQTLLSIKDL